jgi:ribosomal protein S18 acetylase RimI-like enzyme
MTENIRLRSLQPGDYDAIASIAEATPGFSVPTKYMVWMLATTQGELCQVAVDQRDVVIGYTLGMQTSEPEVGFSWQTAVLPEYRSRHVAAALVAHTAKVAKASGISVVRFTSVSAQTETMANLMSAAGIGEIDSTIPIPPEWGIDEVEVRFRLA